MELRPKTILFCAVLALATGLSVLLRGRRTVHFLFAAFATDIAFWYASQSLAGLFQASVWGRVTGVLTVLLPQFAIHLFQNLAPLDVATAKTRLARVGALCLVPMLALELSPYYARPFAQRLLYVYVFGLLAAALFFLARRGLANPSRAVRDRVRFLVAVGALATTFTLADFLAYLMGEELPPIGAVLSVVFLFVLAESLTRPRLTDLYEMAGRLLVSTALAFGLAGIFFIFVSLLGGFGTMYLNAVLAAIIFLVLFEPLRAEIERRIHQFFFRERFDLETTVADLGRRLVHVLEVEELVDVLSSGLDRSRRVTAFALYVRDAEGDGFDLVSSFGPSAPARIEAIGARPILDLAPKLGAFSLEGISRDTTPGIDAVLASAAATLGPFASGVIAAVREETGELVGLLCVADDRVREAFSPEEVTLLARLGAHLGVAVANSRAYAKIKERDRLAFLGQMAAGLAHEVKNPLGAIKGAAQLLEEEGAPPPAKDFVGIILEEVERLDRVVGNFLDYARPHAGNPVPLDLNAAIRRTTQIFSSQASAATLTIELVLGEDIPRARIDAEKFRQVLFNLLQNSAQAMDGEGSVTITTAKRRPTRTSRTGPSSERSGREPEFVEVSVHDTGPGISQKVLKNLFSPFVTTKTRGTGLGLAISQSIVQNVGGIIEVQSPPGAGSTFTIVLPASESIAGATPLSS